MSNRYRWLPMLLSCVAASACTSMPPQTGATTTAKTEVTAGPRQVVTQNDLTQTGQTDLATALRRLVPAIR